jgi:hypothetical protein
MVCAVDKAQLSQRNTYEPEKYQCFVISNGIICISNFTIICEMCHIHVRIWLSVFRHHEATSARPPKMEDRPIGRPVPTRDYGSLSLTRFESAVLRPTTDGQGCIGFSGRQFVRNFENLKTKCYSVLAYVTVRCVASRCVWKKIRPISVTHFGGPPPPPPPPPRPPAP